MSNNMTGPDTGDDVGEFLSSTLYGVTPACFGAIRLAV